MPNFRPGDVIKVPFPYTDRSTRQSRPALVVSAGSLEGAHGLLWMVMIRRALRTPSGSAESCEPISNDLPFADARFEHQTRRPAVGAGAAGGAGIQ